MKTKSLLFVLLLAACSNPPSQTEVIQSGALTVQAYDLLENQRPTEAEKIFEKATQANPENFRALEGLGITLNQLKKHEQADEAYEKALKLRPESASAINNLAMSKILQKEYAKAEKLLAPAHKTNPKNAKIIYNLALTKCMLGQRDEAKKLYSKKLSTKEVEDNLKFCDRLKKAGSN